MGHPSIQLETLPFLEEALFAPGSRHAPWLRGLGEQDVMITESFPPQLPDPIRALTRSAPARCMLPPPGGGRHGNSAVRRRTPLRLPERMNFVDEGPENAPPLVLVHGNLTWSFLFRKLIAEARGHYRVIAPDLVGFGLSSKPRDAAYHTLERHTENLSQLIAELKLPKMTLVLHGMAGVIGFRYAMRFPENVARIVLINAWVHPQAADVSERLPFWPAMARSRVGFMLQHWTLTPFPALQWAAAKALERRFATAMAYLSAGRSAGGAAGFRASVPAQLAASRSLRSCGNGAANQEPSGQSADSVGTTGPDVPQQAVALPAA